MGSYAKAFEIPEAFPAILREFAKEAIREQPADIYKFGHEYFEKLCAATNEELQNGSSATVKNLLEDLPDVEVNVAKDEASHDLGVIKLGVNEVETQEGGDDLNSEGNPSMNDALSDRIALLFQDADSDGNGTLSRMEFQEVLLLFGQGLGLTAKHVLKIMAEADNNDDGVIEYKEFLPVATEIIQAIMAKEQYSENKVIRKKRHSAKVDVQDYLMKGLPRHELEESIQQIFRGADGDGSGALDRAEFIRCLKESGLGFTRRELNLILTLIDKNGDGIIDYQEFMPVCFSMIVELLSDKVQEIPEEEVVLIERVHAFLRESTGNKERMTSSTVSECLTNAGLGLRFVQIPAIISAVEEGEDGLLDAKEVASAVAGIMCALKQLHTRQQESEEDETVKIFKNSRQTEGLAQVAGLDAVDFQAKLAEVLQAKDESGIGTVNSKNVVRDAIREAFPGLHARQVHALASLAEQRPDGRWGFEKVLKWGFRTLQELQDQNILMKSLKISVNGS